MKGNARFIYRCLFFISLATPFIKLTAQKIGSESYWINIDFVHCLEKKLPCACEQKIKTYFIGSIDTNKTVDGACFLKYAENECLGFKVVKLSPNVFNLYDTGGYLSTVFFSKDTLHYLAKDRSNLTFVGFPHAFNRLYTYGDITQNGIARIIDSQFVKRKYGSLISLIGHNKDSIECSCDRHNKINYLFVSRHSDIWTWILEQKNDSLFIFRQTNSSNEDDAQSNPPRITKKLFKVYKWR